MIGLKRGVVELPDHQIEWDLNSTRLKWRT
jgi:hypothetical protein